MKLIFCIFDGCNPKAFLKVVNQEIANNPHSFFYSQLADAYYGESVATFPTVTINEHATLITGCYPDRHGIAGICWFDKRLTDYVHYHPGVNWRSILKHTKDFLCDFVVGLNISHLSPEVKTIFEILSDKFSVCHKEFVARGAWEYSEMMVSEASTWLGRWRDSPSPWKRLTVSILRPLVIRLIGRGVSKEGLYNLLEYRQRYFWRGRRPDIFVYWKAGTDQASHDYGPHSQQLEDEIREGLQRAENAVRFYLEGEEPIVLLITADHSQSQVTEAPVNFSEVIKTRCPELKVGNPLAVDTLHNKSLVVIDNGRSSYVYVLPDDEEEADRIIDSAVPALRDHPAVDLIFLRRGEEISVVPNGGEEKPLDEYNFDATRYPLGSERVARIMNSPRAGDIMISLRPGYSTLKHKGDHGSLLADDSRVPLLVHKFLPGKIGSGRGLEPVKELHRNIDIAPTITALFGKEHLGTDGSPIKEIVNRYSNH